MAEEELVGKIAGLTKDLRNKKTFCTACRSLVALFDDQVGNQLSKVVSTSLVEAGRTAFLVLQTRFSNPKYWHAGLELFLALEFSMDDAKDVVKWRDAAMQEVDEELREVAREEARQRQLKEDRKKIRPPMTMEELLAGQGIVIIDPSERPGMSRDAQHELRVTTLLEDETCPICREIMPAGFKAKLMPCGHKFHDECLITWVKKNKSCPVCRFDEVDSEKIHFDDVQRRVQQADPCSGLYA